MSPDDGDTDEKAIKVAVIFCGGCNPEYDRPSAARRLIRWLEERPGYVLATEEPPDIVVAFSGCDCACAGWTGPGTPRVIAVSGRDEADALLKGKVL